MKVLVLGSTGMVGSSICRLLGSKPDKYEIVAPPRFQLDLSDRAAVAKFYSDNRDIEAVIVAAAHVGGIGANSSNNLDFLELNLEVTLHSISNAYRNGIKKLIYLGSSCIYPKEAEQPIKEDALLTGPLEPTNEGYALAKICGVQMCKYYSQIGCEYTALMPCNLYGPGDNYDLYESHVLPALIRKFYEAVKYPWANPKVTLWGNGEPRREFLHVDDVASACELMLNTKPEHHIYNVGYGTDITIDKLAAMIRSISGYQGPVVYDTSKPNGTMRKLMDSSRIKSLGWNPEISLDQGLAEIYKDYVALRESSGK